MTGSKNMGKITYNIETERQNNTIGKAIAAARKAKGYSIPQFRMKLEAFGVKCGNNAVNKWELGYSIPTAYQLMAVCYVLGIDDVLGYFAEASENELNDEGLKKLEELRQIFIASGKYKREK